MKNIKKFLLFGIQPQKYQLIWVLFFIVSLFSMVFVRDCLFINVNKYFFVLLVFVFSLFSSQTSILLMFLFSISFFSGLPDTYCTLIFFCFFLLKNYTFLQNKKNWLLFVLPALIVSLEILLSFLYKDVDWPFCVRLFCNLSFVFLFFLFPLSDSFCKYAIITFSLGVVLSDFIIGIHFFEVAVYGSQHRFYSGTTVLLALESVRFGDVHVLINWLRSQCNVVFPFSQPSFVSDNANNISFLAFSSCASLLALLSLKTFSLSKKMHTFSWILFYLSFLFGAWTFSRTFFICAAFLLFGYLVFWVVHYRDNVRNIFFIGAFLFVIVCLSFLSSGFLFEKVINRFVNGDSGSLSRFEIIKLYFHFLFSSPKYWLFGTGCTNLNAIANVGISPHSSFLQILCAYGLPFFLLFNTFLFCFFYKKIRRISSSNLFVSCIGLLLTLFFSLSLQVFFPSILVLPFIPVCCALNLYVSNFKQTRLFLYD